MIIDHIRVTPNLHFLEYISWHDGWCVDDVGNTVDVDVETRMIALTGGARVFTVRDLSSIRA